MGETPSKLHMHDMVKIDILIVFEIMGGGVTVPPPPPDR